MHAMASLRASNCTQDRLKTSTYCERCNIWVPAGLIDKLKSDLSVNSVYQYSRSLIDIFIECFETSSCGARNCGTTLHSFKALERYFYRYDAIKTSTFVGNHCPSDEFLSIVVCDGRENGHDSDDVVHRTGDKFIRFFESCSPCL